MNHKEVEKYILSMPNAKLDYPFGEGVAVYKALVPSKKPLVTQVDRVQGDSEQRTEAYPQYDEGAAQLSTQQSTTSAGSVSGFAGKQDSAVRGEWKMFALITEGKEPVQLSLKCDPQLAEVLRTKYESVMPGYHLNKKHWNTIVLTGQLPWEEIQGLIRHSYDLVAGNKNAVPEMD